MQRTMIILVFMSLLCGGLFAQSPEISINCTPSQIFVNSLNTSTFDPVNPQNQPILTTIRIENLTAQPYLYELNVAIKWNSTEIINVTLHSKSQLHPNIPAVFYNSDIITQNASNYFSAPEGDISITSIMEASPVLRNALQSGFFPDGTITFAFTATPIPSRSSSTATFSIRIKNINAIFLTYPGKACGQTPSEISMRPVTFLWNTVNTNANQFRLVVKEFVPTSLPNPNSVETGGNIVYDGLLDQSMFAEFLPFQDRHYYAWQVSTTLFNESNPHIESRDGSTQSSALKSEWFVFKYVADQNASSDASEQMQAILNALSDPAIQNLLAQGFELTGVVIYEGQVYTGQDAIDLINSLLGKNLEIEIKEQ